MIMKKGRITIIKLLIVLLSILFIDGGRTFYVMGDKIQIILNNSPKSDLEIPGHINYLNFNEEEKWMEYSGFDFTFAFMHSVKFRFIQTIISQDFSDSVWQPPKWL
jgi:hypothetical protein